MTDATLPNATFLADRALIRVSGEDVRGFLQGLVTQDVNAVRPDAPLWAALLSPQGKALFDFILWADEADILIDCEAAQRDALIRRLAIYRLRRPITIGATEGGVHWSRNAGNGVPDPRLAALGWRWLGDAAGSPASGWVEHRLRLGVTEGAAELGQDKTLWLECNAAELNGVSFTKGCYVGQENTARMNWRAKVNRRLVVAPLGEPGDRTRATYPDLGLMVEHRRVEALGDAIVPDWLADALGSDA
ncbi:MULTISPECIES: CAF17-like 4Fe-4S cluster assembly/insertion protein YgfZ [unclassified Sphingomonas]|uniref:CAF17-like 4Fe-4S cluster assembly/insertion protein YgfZ n=1 Tax=unclassified Sphingomonas TaxID=196159 RepID=UPI00082C10E1|nr:MULTISPECIES: folate-binding protein YgfZ [unclassified Sphingomonas]